jgi:ACT domain-containing protein
MPRIVTHAELVNVPDGSTYYLEEGAELTPLAAERAQARGIAIHRAPPGTLLAGDADHTASVAEEVTAQVIARLGQVDPSALDRISGRIASEVLAAVQERAVPSAVTPAIGLPPSADYCAAYLEQERSHARRRAVLTATGRNQKGIVARLTAVIAEQGGDILDIAQTLVGEFFTMLVIVDIGDLSGSFAEFKTAMSEAAAQFGAQTILMHEDLVRSLHRV